MTSTTLSITWGCGANDTAVAEAAATGSEETTDPEDNSAPEGTEAAATGSEETTDPEDNSAPEGTEAAATGSEETTDPEDNSAPQALAMTADAVIVSRTRRRAPRPPGAAPDLGRLTP
ncbi:hypothetical protein [Candidatus Poriferisocius sp.]|uniref:hypothetical protein n=1 Tax=Candidatus Poriferisocius sp. TaxID=3101276 RepID=UPI003B025BB8